MCQRYSALSTPCAILQEVTGSSAPDGPVNGTLQHGNGLSSGTKPTHDNQPEAGNTQLLSDPPDPPGPEHSTKTAPSPGPSHKATFPGNQVARSTAA